MYTRNLNDRCTYTAEASRRILYSECRWPLVGHRVGRMTVVMIATISSNHHQQMDIHRAPRDRMDLRGLHLMINQKLR